MPRRYNLRKRDTAVKWIEDETLKEDESEEESEDEDYVPSETEEESEELVDEDEEETDLEEEEEEEEDNQKITIPIPKNGRVKIEIDNRPPMAYEEEEYDSGDEDEDSEEEEDGFLGYLMNKYVPKHKIRAGKDKKKDKEPKKEPTRVQSADRQGVKAARRLHNTVTLTPGAVKSATFDREYPGLTFDIKQKTGAGAQSVIGEGRMAIVWSDTRRTS